MFCKNCGKEIEDNAKFCSYCGSENNVSNPIYVDVTTVNEAVENPKTVSKKKTKKKKTNILIVLLVMIVAGFVGKNVVAPAMLSDSEDTSYNQNHSEKNNFTFENDFNITDNTNNSNTTNSSYSNIFTSRYMVDSPTLFIGYTTDCFAKVEEGGHIIKLAYGHKDNVVYEMEQTIYYNVENMTEGEKNNLIATVKENMKEFENSSACKLTYNETSSSFNIVIGFSNLDQKSNMQEATRLMGSIGGSGDYFSMSITEQNLLDAGFVKK